MTFLLIVLPVILFLLYFGSAPDSSDQVERFANGKGREFLKLPAWAAVAAACAGIFTLLPMRSPGPWTNHTQVAWTGVRSQRGQALQIGGEPGVDDASSHAGQNIGWPLDFRLPAVRLKQNSGSGDSLLISAVGAEGFVRKEKGQELLNGELLSGTFEQTWTEVGESSQFTLSLGPCGGGHWYHPAAEHCLSIARNGETLTGEDEATISFPAKSERAIRLSEFVEGTVQRLRHLTGDDKDRDLYAEQAGSLERWSSTVVLLPRCTKCTSSPRSPQLYLLTPKSPAIAPRSIANGSRIAIIWPSVTLKADAAVDSTGKLSLSFEAPFRHSTPLPPENGEQLLIENTLSPGDVAFLLPLPTGSVPSQLELNPVQAQQSVLSEHKSDNILSLPVAPLGVEVLFQKLQSVPNALWPLFDKNGQPSLVLLVFWAWLCFLGGLYLLAQGIATSRQKVCCMGLVLAAWTVLCVRFLLAFRFALDPAHLDLFSVDQMHEALDALCIGPSAVAFCCGIVQRRREGKKLNLYPLIYIVPLVVNNFSLIPSLWRSLHLSFADASWTNSSTWTFIAVILLCVAASYFVSSSGRQAPPRVVAQLIDDEATFGWGLTPILLVLLCGLLVLAYIANHLAFPVIRSLMKEVGLVLLQFLVIRYGVDCFESRSNYVPPKWKQWPTFNWAMLVVFLFILAPPALDDVGGIIAGCGLLLPFVFIGWSAAYTRSTTSRMKAKGIFKVSVTTLLSIGLLVFAIVKTPLGDFARKHTPASARITHWLSDYAQSQELGARSAGEHGKRSEEQELAETDEQTWQNKAMIVLGDTTGVGFGNSPARRSGIPQHTLQADSTYSFFIASEFGRAGGAALILLFAAPLAFVFLCNSTESLRQKRTRLAIILTAAFLIECLVHIAMNMEIMPMTGRSMPLLSTHSLANTLRWLMLLGLAGSLVWEETPTTKSRSHPFWWSNLPVATGLVCLSFAALVGSMFWWSHAQQKGAWERAHSDIASADPTKIPDDQDLKRAALVFTRSRYMQEARTAIQNDPQLLTVDKEGRIHRTDAIDPDHFASIKFGEEVQRFNGLPDDLRLPSETAKIAVTKQLGSLGPEAYMQALQRDSIRDAHRTAPVAPALFRLDHQVYAGLDDTHFNTDPDTILVNPAFQNELDLRIQNEADIPTLRYANQRSTVWKITIGTLTKFTMQSDLPVTDTAVPLDARNGNLNARPDSGHFGVKAVVQLMHCAEKAKPKSSSTQPVAVFTIERNGDLTVQEVMHITWRGPDGRPLSFGPGGIRKVEDGEHGKTERANACDLRDDLTFNVARDIASTALVGPAWAEGRWRTVARDSSGLTWLPNVARALEASAIPQKPIDGKPRTSYVVTIDPTLQKLTSSFLEEHALKHFYSRPDGHGAPPRAGVVVLDLATGEVLAMAGWPHSSGEQTPRSRRTVDGYLDVQPPERWLDNNAPADVRNHFLGDRNFDALPVGSSTKPIWAAASIATVPDLARMLTRNPNTHAENEIFGIPISEEPWGLHIHAAECCDLTSYLAYSDNRFQTRLNFAALADLSSEGHILWQRAPGHDNQPNPLENFDGKQLGGVPDLTGVHFGYLDSGKEAQTSLQNLDSSRLAGWLSAAFAAETASISRRSHSLSFWTANEASDSAGGLLDDILGGTSPQRARLDLDRVKDAREFVNILLGGSTNRWSNVNLASGFYTALTGRALVPHVIQVDPEDIQAARTQTLPTSVPCALRKGLNNVVMDANGTAHSAMMTDFLPHYDKERYDVYAKTGTLDVRDEGLNMSRIVFALVNHTSRRCPDDVQSGIVISFFVEQVGQGEASRWLNEFLAGDITDSHGRAATIRELMTRAANHAVRPR